MCNFFDDWPTFLLWKDPLMLFVQLNVTFGIFIIQNKLFKDEIWYFSGILKTKLLLD